MASRVPAFSPIPAAPPPPAPPATAGRVRVANAALRFLWTNGWTATPSLEPGRLIDKAAAAARATPDDDRVGWTTRLALLCDDLERHARLNDLGRTIAHGQLVAALAARFRAHALWRRHPEIMARPIAAPIIVVGQMRSGSTRMQRLLACDPRLTYTRFYESWNPIPAGSHRPLVDARKLKTRFALTCARALNPGFDAIHPTTWHAADEEIGLHNLSLYGAAFEAQWRVPGYVAAVEQDDGVAVYGEFRRLLQTLCWLRGRPPAGPWVLKVPQFTQDVGALLHVFPDARVIFLHRDPAAVIASSVSLVCNQMRVQSDAVDPQWVAAEWTRKFHLRDRRIAAARASTAAPHVELCYDDVTRDWAGEMRRVYRMIGLPLTTDVLDRMRRYLASCRHAPRPPRAGNGDAARPSSGG